MDILFVNGFRNKDEETAEEHGSLVSEGKDMISRTN